jgi:hypothetical protein
MPVESRMHRPWRHARDYHEWPNSTPVIDAVGAIVAVASLVIGAHAALFLVFALREGNEAVAADNALIFVGIALANGFVDALRHWRRHHG